MTPKELKDKINRLEIELDEALELDYSKAKHLQEELVKLLKEYTKITGNK